MVEMLPETKAIGLILLSDVVAGKLRPDVGVVLAAGPGVSLVPGATVCVRGYDGQWIEGFDVGEYRTSNQVRVYGKASRFQGELMSTPWSESIPLQIVQDGDEIDMYATHNNLIIQRDPAVVCEGEILLADKAHYRTGMATIVSIGPRADLDLGDGRAEVGDRISYDERGEIDFAFGGDPNLAIIPDLAVNCVIRS